MGRNQKKPEQYEAFAKAVKDGASLKDAMLQAGYSPKQAAKGKAALSKPMLAALAEQMKDFERLGRQITPDQQAAIVRGRLAFNVLNGTDEAAQSAKLLGSERTVNMFTPESQSNMLVIQTPVPSLPVIEDKPKTLLGE